MSQDSRLEQLSEWTRARLREPVELTVASADASFRRYFRVHNSAQKLLAVDAPPAHENSEAFLHISRLIRAAGHQAPNIHASDLDLGFMLIEDFGDTQLADVLEDEGIAREKYWDALEIIADLQQRVDTSHLPLYDEALLRREMSLFEDWLIGQWLGLELEHAERLLLHNAFDVLVDRALEQTSAFVHRDYHSRNLMVLPDDSLGLIDFQDAVRGPVTYDAVSLLRDCYVRWSDGLVEDLRNDFHQMLWDRKVIRARPEQFAVWFDLMGVQRHLKAAGIFARLHLRDGKDKYLDDIPNTLSYVIDACDRHTSLEAFGRFVAERVLPAVEQQLEAA